VLRTHTFRKDTSAADEVAAAVVEANGAGIGDAVETEAATVANRLLSKR
jgi:hypothetical protein